MGMKIKKSDYEIRACPRGSGDYGIVRMTGEHRTVEEHEALCEELAKAIRFRCSELLPTYGKNGVLVTHTQTRVCEFCGYIWGEESTVYNGGCCDKDEKHNPELLKEENDS